MYTAYAALDLNGELVEAGCEKELSHEGLVRILSGLGKPSMVATDVSPAPDFVLRISSRFHVRMHVPQRSLGVAEKKAAARDVQNPHIRDAYAAALKAYRAYANTLRKIEHSDTVLDKDLLKHLFLQGYKVSEAEFMLTKKEEKKMEREGRASPGSPQKQKRDERMLALLEENGNLRKALEMEREKRSALEEKLGRSSSSRSVEVGRDKEVRRLKGQIGRMQVYINRIRRRKGKRD